MEIDKSQFIDSMGRPFTQSLFLEVGYDEERAVYTLKDYDWVYKDKTFLSLKKLYLAHEDPIEYDFATTYLLGWNHWMRLCDNKLIRKHIDQWRAELDLKLASQSIRDIIGMSSEEKGFQAAKYVAERGWNKNPVGRPKKDTSERDAAIEDRINGEFADDVDRMRQKLKEMN